MNEQHRVAVITGAAGSIGSEIAKRLRRDGLTVVCVDRNDDAVRRIGRELEAAAFVCDISSSADVARLKAAIQATSGPVDVLVNAAGVFKLNRVTEVQEEEWQVILDTNLTGPFLTSKAFLPEMIARGSGCIVNVGSTAGLRGGHDRPAYAASKGGLVLLTESLALDHGADGVRINSVCPGLIDTEMAQWITNDPEARTRFEASIPAGRVGTAADVASAVSFLVSDDASYVYGANLVVDGGWLLT